jgi:hypothetical protein
MEMPVLLWYKVMHGRCRRPTFVVYQTKLRVVDHFEGFCWGSHQSQHDLINVSILISI